MLEGWRNPRPAKRQHVAQCVNFTESGAQQIKRRAPHHLKFVMVWLLILTKVKERTFFACILSALYCCCRVLRNAGCTGFQVNGNVLAEITLFVDAFVPTLYRYCRLCRRFHEVMT